MKNVKRATTPELKRIVIEALYSEWFMKPDLRLGQLLTNYTEQSLFIVEDFDLVLFKK
jgi:hypothetical protein